MLPFAKIISGSSTDRVAVFTVTVSPLTVKSPAIVTSFGRPTVIVPELSPTSTSFDIVLEEEETTISIDFNDCGDGISCINDVDNEDILTIKTIPPSLGDNLKTALNNDEFIYTGNDLI